MLVLRLESPHGDLNLNEIAETGVGIQATLGATGFGLPPVEHQWAQGAGDGAKSRGRRVQPRDLDLPLYIEGRDREHLKQLVDTLSLVLGDTIRLIAHDTVGQDTWYLDVLRVGGGDWVYGDDTTGERDAQTVITVRAGDPYWTAYTPSHAFVTPAGGGRGLLMSGDSKGLTHLPISSGQQVGTMQLANTGQVDAYPVWEVHGPGSDFKAISPSGKILRWQGSLEGGEWVRIDTRTGEVIDNTGANRYSDLAAAPKLWRIPPGTHICEVTIVGSDEGGHNRVEPPRVQHVTNPSFEVDLAGWAGHNTDGGTNATLTRDTTVFRAPGVASLRFTMNEAGQAASTTVTGLTIGQPYRASTWVYLDGADAAEFGASIRVAQTGDVATVQGVEGWCEVAVEFTANATSHVIYLLGADPGAEVVNLITNPNAGVNTTGVVAANGNVTRSIAQSRFGSASFRFVSTSTGLFSRYLEWTALVTEGLSYTASAYVMNESLLDVARMRLSWKDAIGNTLQTDSGSGVDLTEEDFERASLTADAPEGATQVKVQVRLERASTPTPSSGSAFVDGVMLTEGSELHDFGDGSIAGWVWDGTADASTSRRPATPPITYWFDNVYVGTGGSYFDASMPDTYDTEYDWAGTPHASQSEEYTMVDEDSTEIKCSWHPRKWAII